MMFASTSIYDFMTSSIPQNLLNMCIIAGQRFICCIPILVMGMGIVKFPLCNGYLIKETGEDGQKTFGLHLKNSFDATHAFDMHLHCK